MFSKIISENFSQFSLKQNSVLDAIAASGKDIVEKIMAMDGAVNFGRPPYIIDDGEQAILFLDAHGTFSRISPSFRLDEDSVNDDYDSLYTMNSPIGMIRFVPANSELQFPSFVKDQQSLFTDDAASALDGQFDILMNLTKEIVQIEIAKSLISIEAALDEAADESGTPFATLLRSPDIFKIFVPIFKSSMDIACEKASEIVSRQLDAANSEEA